MDFGVPFFARKVVWSVCFLRVKSIRKNPFRTCIYYFNVLKSYLFVCFVSLGAVYSDLKTDYNYYVLVISLPNSFAGSWFFSSIIADGKFGVGYFSFSDNVKI